MKTKKQQEFSPTLGKFWNYFATISPIVAGNRRRWRDQRHARRSRAQVAEISGKKMAEYLLLTGPGAAKRLCERSSFGIGLTKIKKEQYSVCGWERLSRDAAKLRHPMILTKHHIRSACPAAVLNCLLKK